MNPGHLLMKTKDQGTAWLLSHGWVQCEGRWVKATQQYQQGQG